MDKTIQTLPQTELHLPDIHRVEAMRPFQWLAAGGRDLRRAPATGLLYGALFALLGYGLYSVSEGAPNFVMTYVAGFFLVGPFLATGLYAVAHRLEHHQPAHLGHALSAWHRSGLQMGIYAAMLGFLMVFWIRLAWLMIGLAFQQGGALGFSDMTNAASGGAFGLSYLALYLVLGAAFAALVFAISVIALPMLQDRRVDIVTAMLTSLKAVRLNPGAMIVWAALIVGLTLIGFATLLLGLVVTFPLLAFATWHAYRDLIPRQH